MMRNSYQNIVNLLNIFCAFGIIQVVNTTGCIHIISFGICLNHIYFIAETKGTTLLDRNELRGVEDLKIQCAKAHFAAISNDSVVYDVVDSYDKLMQVVME